jgi:DNA replication protein DnaC
VQLSALSTGRSCLEILDDRDGNRSTLITSQLPIDRWHEHLGDPTPADAILNRVVHRAYRLGLTGPSRRKSNGLEPPKDAG